MLLTRFMSDGVRLARDLGRPADLGRWTAARDAVYEQIMFSHLSLIGAAVQLDGALNKT